MSNAMHVKHLQPVADVAGTLLPSRRDVVRALAGVGVSLGLVGQVDPSAAKRKKKRKKIQIRRNAFGCVDVGARCENAEQCCSGVCLGKKGKKSCLAHHESTCLSGQSGDFCGGATVSCPVSNTTNGVCLTTTGNAGFCAASAHCFACTKDADCTGLCGDNAACVQCQGCPDTGGVTCVGAEKGSCPLMK